MSIAYNIKELRLNHHLSQKEFAAIAGVSDKAVSTWENGTKIPRMGAIQKIADHFGILKSDIIEPTPESTKRENKIPILGSVAAGTPIEAYEDLLGYVEDKSYHNDGEKYFALRIAGHSMEPTIKDGDIVIVRQQPTVDSGDIAIVLVDGESATAKEVHIRKDGITLVGHNPSVYTPHFYSNEDVATLPVNILGRVMEVRRYL